LNEKEWIKEVKKRLEKEIFFKDTNPSFYDGRKIPYSFEIISYKDNEPEETNPIKYETDLIICQNLSENEWKPRIIIEGKLNSVTTHDAITYSQKAAIHINVHPFLRYGKTGGGQGFTFDITYCDTENRIKSLGGLEI
jgi:hypothetical protein